MSIKESIEHFDHFLVQCVNIKYLKKEKKSNLTSILNVSFDGHGDFPQSKSKPSNCLFNLKKGIFFILVCF